jgi:hypothetical protein
MAMKKQSGSKVSVLRARSAEFGFRDIRRLPLNKNGGWEKPAAVHYARPGAGKTIPTSFDNL